MKRSLLLAFWSTGVLGGPCKPSKPSETSIADGISTESNQISLALSSTYIDSTKTSQDSGHETSTVTSPHESGHISVSIPFSESDLKSHTQGSGSNTIGLSEGSVTGTASLPEPTSESGIVSGTSTEVLDSEETAGGAGTSGSPSSPHSEGSSPTGTAGSPVERSSTATSPEDSDTTGTVSVVPEESSGTLINTEVSGQPTGTVDVPGTTDANTATEIPATISGAISGDASATATNHEAAGSSASATVPVDSQGTESSTGISEGISEGPSGTTTGVAEAGTTAHSGAPGDASDTSSSVGDSGPTGVATDGTSNGGSAPSHGSADTLGSPHETASGPGTEQGQSTATQTELAPGTDGAPTGTETSVSGPDQPVTTAPANTISDDQSTLTQSNGDGFTSAASGIVTETHSGAITTEANDAPNTLPNNQDQTTGSPEESNVVPSDQNSTGTTNETSPGQEDSSVVSNTDANAAQPTTEGDDTTTNLVPDNTNVSSTGSSGANNGATPTDSGLFETTDSNEVRSTTVPGPSATSNPITTAATTTTGMPVVTEAPPGFNPTTVSDHPEWTSNTWITTTSDGSEPTVVPVLVGCNDCGGIGSGIILWDFPPVPNTWFQLPGLPKFSFTCIPPASGCTSTPVTEESGEDGDEDDEQSSRTTCTDKVTVTDCFVACTTYTGPAGETVTPECQTTCTRTQTGCSVTGTTTTSSAAVCGPSGESECTACTVDVLDDDDDSESLRRRSLERRGDVDIKNDIAGCDWSGTAVGAPRFPAYPGGNRVLNNEAKIVKDNSPLNQIKRWWRMTRDSTCVPHLNKIDESQFPKNLPSDVGPSIDHVYEKSMLLDFWRFIIDPAAPAVVGMTSGTPNKINCNDIKSYGGINSGTNLIQKVFDTYPGSQDVLNPEDAQFMDDFIGMDQWTNGIAKAQITDPQSIKDQADKKTSGGKAVSPKTSIKLAGKWINDKMVFLEALAIGVEMFNVQEAKDALIRQNLRIYQAL